MAGNYDLPVLILIHNRNIPYGYTYKIDAIKDKQVEYSNVLAYLSLNYLLKSPFV